jgi:phenylacetaldehyde dehydrogenase
MPTATASEPAVLPTKATQFLSAPRKNLIDGKWVDAVSGETFAVYAPSNGETIARVPDSGAEDIDRAVNAARRAFESGPWPKMSPSDRGRLIWRIGNLILANLEELAEIESIDNGKPLSVARVADIPLSADLLHYMAGWES